MEERQRELLVRFKLTHQQIITTLKMFLCGTEYVAISKDNKKFDTVAEVRLLKESIEDYDVSVDIDSGKFGKIQCFDMVSYSIVGHGYIISEYLTEIEQQINKLCNKGVDDLYDEIISIVHSLRTEIEAEMEKEEQ